MPQREPSTSTLVACPVAEVGSAEKLLRDYAAEVAALLDRLDWTAIQRLLAVVLRAHAMGRQIFLLGNGGSATTASHVACDLAKAAAVLPGSHPSSNGIPRLRAMALTDSIALLTAWANDTAYENVFAEQLRNLVQPGDVLIVFSTSGNSPNVLRAVEVARQAGAFTAGLAGYSGGRLASMVDLPVVVPGRSTGQIEDAHLVIMHAIVLAVSRALHHG